MKADDTEESTYAFIRKCPSSKRKLLFVMNMTPMERKGYRVGVPKKKKYKLILNSDDVGYGGEGREIPEVIQAEKTPCDYRDYSITFDLPPWSSAVFSF